MSITASVYKKRFLQKSTVLAVVVVERFKQELMYGLSAGTRKIGRCREVAVVERWPLVEVRLYKQVVMECFIYVCFRLHLKHLALKTNL